MRVALLHPDAPLGPTRFLVTGVWLFALKFLLDRLLATLAFGRSWSIYNYLLPLEGYRFWRQAWDERLFYACMLALAVPFVWIGIIVTLRRLHDARLPRLLVTLFFLPAINLVFFAVLSVIPTA